MNIIGQLRALVALSRQVSQTFSFWVVMKVASIL